MAAEFEEIGHSGGTITFDIQADGRYSIQYRSDRPVPVSLIGFWIALPQMVAIAPYNLAMGGRDAPGLPGCFPVIISSDSEGKHGHRCEACNGYWRSGPAPTRCPYCGRRAPYFHLLSEAQRRFTEHYCNLLANGLDQQANVSIVINMDEVADAVKASGEKPAFYVSEESQQHKFNCSGCGEFNDILGRFGYCSLCGERNDLVEFEAEVKTLRERVNTDVPSHEPICDAVGKFDSFVAQYAKQLAVKVPMVERRRKRLLELRFHDLGKTADEFKNWFGIDFYDGVGADDQALAERLFHRRHVYEHNGGEVDQKYIDDSGDQTVRVKQHIRETREDAHKVLNILSRAAKNLHHGFHSIFPPKR